MKYNTQRPYIASYLLVQNDEGKLAFLMRHGTSWMNDHYGLPSGKVEKDERYIEAAVREAKEEIGIDVIEKDLEYALTVHRGFTDQDKLDVGWVDVYFVIKKWTGEIHNAEPHMHSELAWLDPDDLPNTVIPSHGAGVAAWRAGKVYDEYGWE